MNKNTVWAIVLSTLVIFLSYFVLPLIFPSLRPVVEAPAEVAAEMEAEAENSGENQVAELELGLAEEKDSVQEEEVKISEETITVLTDKAEIILTNKGGDILSYKLVEHNDKDTGTGVQISDNVSDVNRTCALALGIAENKIIDDLFTVEKVDDYTYFFKKNFSYNGKKFSLGKRYTFMPGEYVFKLDIFIHTDNVNGLNFDGASYTLRTSPQIGPHFNPKQNRYENRQYLAFNGSKTKKIVLGSNQFKRYDKDFVWSGIAGKYFIELVIPSSAETINAGFYSSAVEVEDYANAQAMLERKAFTGSDIQDSYYMYFGPRNEKELKRYNVSENNGWGLSGYRLNQALQTYDWLKWLETILKFILELLYKVVRNWGVAIIIMTILLKLAMFPLSKKQSLGTLKMQELQPKMQAIQAKYKDDQQKMQIETSKLYKEAGYNPASGCLPMLFQFLILFAMYDLFNNYFEFRGAMFIPGWIPDLSAGDSVYTLTKFSIPLLGNQIRILPVVYVASQLLFGKITQNGGMTAANGQNAATMKFMTYGMPIMFFFLFYNAPSGLILYWTISNFFQMGQQIIINKMMAEKKAEMTGKNSQQKTIPPKEKGKRK
ncbi:MAG: membrane protein insertase YidC [Treponema sp.]|nr:membrane protein insertase YidC [Treponema sp.]